MCYYSETIENLPQGDEDSYTTAMAMLFIIWAIIKVYWGYFWIQIAKYWGNLMLILTIILFQNFFILLVKVKSNKENCWGQKEIFLLLI